MREVVNMLLFPIWLSLTDNTLVKSVIIGPQSEAYQKKAHQDKAPDQGVDQGSDQGVESITDQSVDNFRHYFILN